MKLLLKPEEAGEALGLSRAEAYRWIKDGRMPGVVNVEGRIRVSVRALVEWIRLKECGTSNENHMVK